MSFLRNSRKNRCRYVAATLAVFVSLFACGKKPSQNVESDVVNLHSADDNQQVLANWAANTNCHRVMWEFHCDITEGVVDIGDGQATAVRLFNRTGKTLKIEKIEVPWFAGSATGCFAEFGVSRNEVHMGQPSTPYIGEIAFSPKLSNESQIPPIQLSKAENFRIDPNDQLVIYGKNGCYQNTQPNPPILAPIPSETPITFRVSVSKVINQDKTVEIWRQPRMDPISIACNGTTQHHSGINFNKNAQIIQQDGPWRNETGKAVEITGAMVYAVGGDQRDFIDDAKVHVCRDAACNQKIGTWSHESLRKRGQSEAISMWVNPSEYVLAEVSNKCSTGDNWNYVAFLKVSVPVSKQILDGVDTNKNGCFVSLTSCSTQPSIPVNSAFIDDFEGAGSNLNRCLARAEEYMHWCNIPINNTVGVEFFRQGVVVASTTVAGIYQAPQVPAPPAPPAPQTHDVYRLQKNDASDYLYSTDSHEGAQYGYQYEGIAFKLFSEHFSADVSALYRCARNGKHFLSLAANCDGATVEGRIGYVFRNQQDSTSELFRCRAPNGKYFITTERVFCLNYNFTIETSLGFVKR